MKALNQKERYIAFAIFILLFITTVTIIVTAIYFNFHIPWKENKELKKQNDIMKNEFRFQEKFSGDMEILKKYIDSIDMPKEDPYYHQQKSINQIIIMENLIPPKDSIYRDMMYSNILLTNRNLIDAKKTIKTYGKSKGEIDTLLAQLQTYKDQIALLRRDLEVCRLINKKD